MFRQVIRQTQMTSDAANNFFQHITGQNWNGDVTFLSTLRALVAPRMQEGERLTLSFKSSSYSASEISGIPAKRAVSSIVGGNFDNNGIVFIHNFASPVQEDNYANLELVKSTFSDVYKGFYRLDKVTDFFRKTFYVVCFINPDTKSVVIFTENMDIKKMHYLQCSIFAFLPWYFDPNEGVSETEMELIRSLREKASTKYEDCISKIANKYDFKTARIRQLLSGFETRFERQECERIRNTISDTDRRIEEYTNEISEYLKQRRDFEVRLLGLEMKVEQGGGDSEIMDYFMSNNKLFLNSVDDSQMVFSVKGYITYFDEDMAKTIIDKPESYVYRSSDRACNNYIPAEDMKRLMYAIFIEQTIRVRFCAAYCFDIRNQSVRGISGWDYGIEFRDYMPNTHIDRFSCMGNYSNTINRLLKNNDYIGAIEQCVASCQSLNFADSTVMREFMCRMYGLQGHTNVNNRCIELEDGSIVTPKEASEILKNREESTDE